MTDYNKQLCDILNDVNFFMKPKKNIEQEEKQNEQSVKSTDISNAIDNVEQCTDNPNINIVIGYVKKLMSNPETAKTVVKLGNKGLNIAKTEAPSPSSVINGLYDKLLDLNNNIQDETINIYNKYSNQTDSLMSEQNKQFENFKFNKIYLFIFNLGIIFIILRNSYFKKTY